MSEKMKSSKETTIVMSNDNGMGSNKITYGLDGTYYQFDFPSRYLQVEKETPDTVVINDKIYTFSEGKLAAANGHKTKDNEIHETLLKKAIYEVHKKTGATSFDVVTNYSLDSYKDDKGAKVLNAMSKERTIRVRELYTEEVELTINRIDCFAECLTGGILVPLKLKEEDVVMIDIGTKDLQLLRVSQGTPNYVGSKSVKVGMDFIYRAIADITKTLEIGINDDIAVKMYLEKTASGEMDIIEKIDDKILEYLMSSTFDEIDRCLNEMGISMFTKIILLGGGSTLLKRFLDARFIQESKRTVHYVNNGYYANSLGLFKRAEKLYGYEKHKPQEEEKVEEKTSKPKRTSSKPRKTTKKTETKTKE